jgi:hypothetical protein
LIRGQTIFPEAYVGPKILKDMFPILEYLDTMSEERTLDLTLLTSKTARC